MQFKIIGLILVVFLLLGCIVEPSKETQTDLNKNNQNPTDSVFCEMSKEHKFYYEENYYTQDMVFGVTTQRYQKQTLTELKYFEKLKDAPKKVGTWGFATKDEFIVYSNANGECFAMKHGASANPFLMKEPIYYSNQFSGETKQIGGSEIGWKLKQSENLAEGLNTEIVTLGDYISKDYCISLTQDVNSFDYTSHSEKVNFTRVFDEGVFELPIECKNAPMTDLTSYNYEESYNNYEEEFEEDYTEVNGSNDKCIAQCQKMREICQVDGLEVTQDGQGCYNPNDGEYQRHCEYVCWSI